MNEASWPIFIAAPFMRPSVSTICSAASRWRCSSACAASSGIAGEVARAGAGVAGALRAHDRAHLGGAADAPLRNVGCRPRAPRPNHRKHAAHRAPPGACQGPRYTGQPSWRTRQRPTLDVEDRPERGTRAAKRLRREGYVPGVVYGGKERRLHLLQGRTPLALRQVLVDGSALIDLEGRRQDAPGDRQGPAAAPGPRRAAPHRPARGPPRREDPDAGERPPRGRRGGARHQGGRRARARDPPAEHRGAAYGHPRRTSTWTCPAWRSPRRMHLSEITAPEGVTFLDDPEETIIATVVVPTEVEEPEIEEETELVGEEGEEVEEVPRARRRRGRQRARPRRGGRGLLSLFRRGRREGRTGWSSGSGIRATATPGRATTSASRWRSWRPSAGACRGSRRSTAASTPRPHARRSARGRPPAADLHERVGRLGRARRAGRWAWTSTTCWWSTTRSTCPSAGRVAPAAAWPATTG